MTSRELRASVCLALIFGLRLFGLFVILPVFALYAEGLPGWNLTLVGIAVGAYGLTQALLQIPFGWASDRVGRKQVLVVGLLLMLAGSVVCSVAQSPWAVIAGRILQGAGAISGVAMAMVGDYTRDSQRAKAMAFIGSTVTLAFGASFVAAPVLEASIGVPGIFGLTALLSAAAVPVVIWGVPPLVGRGPVGSAPAVRFGAVLADPALVRVNVGIFALRAILMALFVVVPQGLAQAGLDSAGHASMYLLAVVVGFLLAAPAIFGKSLALRDRAVVLGAIGLLVASLAVAATGFGNLAALAVALVLFFTAVNVLEARLPAIMSRRAPPSASGSASGVFATVQFLGTFCGAAAGGAVAQHFGSVAVIAACLVVAAAWFLVARPMAGRTAQASVLTQP